MKIYNQIAGKDKIIVWANKNTIPKSCPILNTADSSKYEDIKKVSRKEEFYSVRWLLNEIYPSASISYSKTGKPILSNGKEMSISHSGDIIALAITSNQLCGIDVQELSDKTIKLRQKFLSEDEMTLINEDSLIENCLAWSSKETLFKMVDEENMPFKTCFKIKAINKLTISTNVSHQNFEGEFNLNYKVFDTFVMVYYIG